MRRCVTALTSSLILALGERAFCFVVIQIL